MATVNCAMDFVAVDFETANEKRCSPCSIGVVIFKDGEPAETISTLIRPPEMRFSRYNSAIHGIRPEDVEDEPEFCDLWGHLRPHFEGRLVISHNALFDISVLRHTLDIYGIPYPNLRYQCTMLLSKIVWPGLPSYGLGYLCTHWTEFCHHDAAEDASRTATACEACVPTEGSFELGGSRYRYGYGVRVAFPRRVRACGQPLSTAGRRHALQPVLQVVAGPAVQ